jgi:hypothetical protein
VVTVTDRMVTLMAHRRKPRNRGFDGKPEGAVHAF